MNERGRSQRLYVTAEQIVRRAAYRASRRRRILRTLVGMGAVAFMLALGWVLVILAYSIGGGIER